MVAQQTTKFQSIYEMFDRIAERQADAPALCFAAHTFSYHDLRSRSDLLADLLLSRHLPPASLVALLCDHPFHLLCAILATLKAGLAFVPLDPTLPTARLRLLLGAAQPALFVAEQSLLDIIPQAGAGAAAKVICLNCSATPTAAANTLGARLVAHLEGYEGVGLSRPVPDPEGLCYIYFTSGSTGRPKAIGGRLKGIDHFIRWEAEVLGMSPGRRVSQLLAPSFDGSLRDMFLPLCTGGVMVAPPERGLVRDAEGLAAWLVREGIEVMHCVPSMM